MNDQISRRKLIEELEKWRGELNTENALNFVVYTILNTVIDITKYQPPADVPDTNVGEWIPCSERLPEEPCIYTVEDSSPYTVKKFGKPQRYVWKVLPYSLEMYHRLVAWKPVDPEPYKGE